MLQKFIEVGHTKMESPALGALLILSMAARDFMPF
jgi:hypothetical protein